MERQLWSKNPKSDTRPEVGKNAKSVAEAWKNA